MSSTRDQRRASTGSSVNTGGAKNHAEEAQWKPTTASGGGSCGVISKTRLRFFSERRRTDREQAPVAEFLKYLGVIFSTSPPGRRGGSRSRASAGSPALDEPATLAPDTIARGPVIRHDAMHGGSASLRHLPHEPAAGRSRASGAAGLLSQPRRPRPRHLPPERLGGEPRPVARAWAPDPVACLGSVRGPARGRGVPPRAGALYVLRETLAVCTRPIFSCSSATTAAPSRSCSSQSGPMPG